MSASVLIEAVETEGFGGLGVVAPAYLPHLTSRQALRLLTKLRRPHASRSPVQQSERRTDARSHGR
jgi:hypothetical protein